ncbi:cation transporter [Hydrogenophaga sp. OTU3427]|uniref:cation transporter n=1 Tax=Hydrogenophaga sp. OTU3427 TaxID=3043856 RepID=UPI00313E9A6B
MACTSCPTDLAPSHTAPDAADPRWRRVLWIALIVNAGMFVVELLAGLQANSVSLLADAVDFAGDAANYALSLAVLGMALAWRSRAALVKGVCMFTYGVLVLLKAAWVLHIGAVPEPLTMGIVGFVALLANTGVALALYTFRTGDANMRSVWLCSRNDALSNLAVMLAALGVFGTGSAWPDLAVAGVMAALALSAGWQVVRQARAELAGAPAQAHHGHVH